MPKKQGTTKESKPGNHESVCDIPIEQIVIGERRGRLRESWVEAIAASMSTDGQHKPILVRPQGKKFNLIDGRHRITAKKRIGETTIRAVLRKVTPLEAKLLEIDTTLLRRDLNALERAEFLAARKAIYEEMNPAAKQGGDRKSEIFKNQNDIMSFSSETAEKIGLSRKSIERAVRIYWQIGPEIRARIADMKLAENQTELLALADQGPQAQTRIVDLIDKGEAGNVRAAVRIVEGHVKPEAKGKAADSADKQFQKLFEAWRRAGPEAKRRFIGSLREGKDYGAFLSILAEDPNAIELMRNFTAKKDAA